MYVNIFISFFKSQLNQWIFELNFSCNRSRQQAHPGKNWVRLLVPIELLQMYLHVICILYTHTYIYTYTFSHLFFTVMGQIYDSLALTNIAFPQSSNRLVV